MSYALVHSAHGNSGTGANSNNPFNLTVTATTVGNLGVLDFETGNGETLTSVTDSGSGNTWHQIGSQVADTTNGQIYYRFYLQVSGSFTTIHLTGNTALQAISWVFGEFSSTLGWAATPLNTSNNGTLGALSTGTDGVLSNNITPLATDLLVSGLDSGDGTTPTFTAGTGWTIVAADAGTSANTGATGQEWKAATSGTSQHSTWTTSLAQNGGAAAIAAFSQGSGALPNPPTVIDFAVQRAANY